jgi:hypothetical protein
MAKKNITDFSSLVTPYEQIRAGFISLALEKNRLGTPFIEEAKALKAEASKSKCPKELLKLVSIRHGLLTAAGISDKASKHLTDKNKTDAIQGLIEKFLEPAGKNFVDELVYRFLLTRGDTLGGAMRNTAGKLGEKKFIRALISSLSVGGRKFKWLDTTSKQWITGKGEQTDIENYTKAISWRTGNQNRVLVLNILVPITKTNVDISLMDCSDDEIKAGKKSIYNQPDKYIALGELKGGIDPAGADEHWKTANSALNRIRDSFAKTKHKPHTFFVGAAIENAMAKEIFKQLQENILTRAGNLTNDAHLLEICSWLIGL